MTEQHSVVVRALWFVFVGWWLTLIAINVAWLLNVTIVLLPLGIKLINKVPTLVSLRRREPNLDPHGTSQTNLLVRAVYFVVIGWWASLIWANVAWVFCVTIIGIPIGVWMFGKLPFVTSLYRIDA